jgi:hypothetical protein
VHTDADKRLSREVRKSINSRQAGRELGEEMDRILSEYGESLRKFAPRTWRRFMAVRASYYFLSGSTRAGLAQTLGSIYSAPFSKEAWQTLAGLAGPRFFAWLRSWRPPPT